MSLYITDNVETYEAAKNYIMELPRFTRKNSMEHTKRFLGYLCSMEDLDKIKVIHVAGTNGKGSVCAYLHSILQEAGISNGMFTSPHLVSIRERFLINGQMVSKEDFLWAFGRVAGKISHLPEDLEKEGYHPTFFEFLFFMAVVLFVRYRVQYMILETGLGGRLDATNALDKKEVCVITSIGYDHMEYLGETLPEIAAEKAGIFRKNVPAVYFEKEKSVSETLEKCADFVGAKTFSTSFRAIKEINSHDKTIDFSLQSNYYGYIRLRVPTIATYQIENAALAVAALEKLSDREFISVEQIQSGIEKMRWEARMEEIMPSVYLDGAHNIDGIQAFLQTVRQDGCKGKRLLLFSMVKEKQYRDVMDMLAASGLFKIVGVVAILDKRALPLRELADYFGQYTELQIRTYDRLESAVQDMAASRNAQDRVYIVGSLYLAGEVKALLRRRLDD
ncbi:MAG: bifunctional folylpolyglutamate synthase/dihydrofolate synthase [Bacillus sp. (in: Bacteria)]|nr:bifunctional folylpolyglutamate synthase/dihydrofolate synthase [Bacillus sp. (in: firmicutes)]MCM1426787.1 bifunctional folylpolyglutamate synthase/dihydrofolate synthase [Eubacterium sp.]